MNDTPTAFAPGPTPNTVRAPDGALQTVPDGWVLVPPGDAALTRRVRTAGESWSVAEKRGRKVFSRGVWASASTVERVKAELTVERSTETYARKRKADAGRREKAHVEYVEEFAVAVRTFL